MTSDSTPVSSSASHGRVPEELLAQLHAANEHLAESSRRLDSVSELGLQERRALAQEIRAAYRQWQEVTRLIEKAMEQ